MRIRIDAVFVSSVLFTLALLWLAPHNLQYASTWPDLFVQVDRMSVQNYWMPYQGAPGVNHLAYEVDDVEALCQRMMSAGYQDSTPPNAHPYRKRRYFYDPEGNDWEFVEYLSQESTQRNDYTLPDR